MQVSQNKHARRRTRVNRPTIRVIWSLQRRTPSLMRTRFQPSPTQMLFHRLQDSTAGQWAQSEKRIREYATSVCGPNGGNLYLITGISEASLQMGMSGLEAIQNTLKALKPRGDNITIPISMWTAGCCIVPPRGALGAFAVIGNNRGDKSKVFMSQVNMTEQQNFLLIGVSGFGGAAIDLFPANPGCSDPKKGVNLLKRPRTE